MAKGVTRRDGTSRGSAPPQGGRKTPYTREILRLAASIPYLEPFEELEGATEVRSKTCGSRMRMAIELDWADRVVRLRQSVEACAYGQATAALMGGHAIGRSAEEVATTLAELEAWLGGSGDVPTAWPGLEALAPALQRKGRHGAILLPFRTLLAAFEDAR
jgi:NifU-like protein involved in Fe-S cluster formation